MNMKKVFLQYWEESIVNQGVRPDGCSLHSSLTVRNSFIKSFYESRVDKDVPNEYDSAIGDPIEAEVTEPLWNEIEKNGGSLRIMQHSLSNLRALDEITIPFDEDYDY